MKNICQEKKLLLHKKIVTISKNYYTKKLLLYKKFVDNY